VHIARGDNWRQAGQASQATSRSGRERSPVNVQIDAPIAARRSLPGVATIATLIRHHPLVAFFTLAYGISWAMLLILYGLLGLPAGVVILLQTLGPTLAALATLSALEGDAGRRRLLARVRMWRVARRWYLFALVAIPGVCLLTTLALPGAFVGLGGQSAVKLVIEFLAIVLVGFLSGPLFEEPGWRGFALPRLQSQMGPVRGTLLLGVLWAAWHLPQYLVPEWANENGGLTPTLVVTFLLFVVAIAPIMTWLYNSTKGSLLLVMLAHSAINAALVVFVVSTSAVNVGLVGFGALSVVLILMTRGRLGYVPSEELG
jgi:membrane protease YdiL (CAAX protease family)